MKGFTLEEYRIQRQYRQNRRKQFIRRFQILKEKMPLNSSSTYVHSKNQIHEQRQKSTLFNNKKAQQQLQRSQKKQPIVHSHVHHNHHQHSQSDQISKQFQLNRALKQQLQQIQTQERNKLMEFKEQISSIKQKYIAQIKSISAMQQKSKAETDEKMNKIIQQMQNGKKKNEQIKKFNEELRKQLTEVDTTMGTYTTEIKNQYAKKLNQFQKIYNSSNQKILQMQKQFDEEEFVNNALANQDLLKTIQQNANKSQQAVKILQDYKQLLAGKSQILKQINSNIEMKEKQLDKMGQLEGKMKIIFEKMNAEKKTYITENQKMTKQLMEIKELIMGFVSQAEGGQA